MEEPTVKMTGNLSYCASNSRKWQWQIITRITKIITDYHKSNMFYLSVYVQKLFAQKQLLPENQ